MYADPLVDTLFNVVVIDMRLSDIRAVDFDGQVGYPHNPRKVPGADGDNVLRPCILDDVFREHDHFRKRVGDVRKLHLGI